MTKLTGRDVPSTLPQTDEEMERRAAGEDFDYFDENGDGHFYDHEDKTPRNSDAFDVELLRGISTFEEARAIAATEWGEETDATKEIGTGFAVLNGKEKDRLVGTPFIILSLDFNEGDMGEFVSFLAVTEDNRKYVINDGSTGIHAQLKAWYEKTKKGGGILVRGGLRRSEYDNPNGEGRSTTYYLNV